MANAKHAETLYRFTVPVFIKSLENAARILVKTERHAKRHGIDVATLLSARLFPDMYPLLQQVQYLCFIPVDFAKNFSTGAAPRVGYDEKTLADLKSSITKTQAYLRKIRPAQFGARGTATLPLFFDPSQGLPAEAHVARFTLPNFFFHATAAYAILRHNGVPLGKADFIGPLGARPIKKQRR